MASLWEIFDTSNLRYNTELGFTRDDSGFGPPAGFDAFGWVRTGNVANPAGSAGISNCNAWTSKSISDFGTGVYLDAFWDFPDVKKISPWLTGAPSCFSQLRVWCVQD
jgi:hypothetical protein